MPPMRASALAFLALSLLAATASAERAESSVSLELPAIPAALTGSARTSLEAMLALARDVGALVRIGGAVSPPCGLVFQRGDRVALRVRLTWRAGRLVERVEWLTHEDRDPTWRHTRRTWRGASLVSEVRRVVAYRDGEPDCSNTVRTTITRDARGRIVSRRTHIDTCEGVDSGTRVARYAWQRRVGFEEATVSEEGDTSARIFVPSERDAWAEIGPSAATSWLDVRDTRGALRVRIEGRDVGHYTYACDDPVWPSGASAPERIESRRSSPRSGP